MLLVECLIANVFLIGTACLHWQSGSSPSQGLLSGTTIWVISGSLKRYLSIYVGASIKRDFEFIVYALRLFGVQGI